MSQAIFFVVLRGEFSMSMISRIEVEAN